MSWRDSLWAAAAVAATLKDQAQSTLTSAAAQVQQTYHDATNNAATAYAPVEQDDTDAHAPAATNGTRHGNSHTADSTSLTSITASFPSLTALSSSLPSSLTSLSLPTALSSRLSALTDASPPNTAPAPADSDTEQSEQLITRASHSAGDSIRDSDVAVLTLDADEVELPSLVVNKTSLQMPIKPAARASDSEEAPSLYYTPQQHRAKQQRDTNGHHSNINHTASSSSPEHDAYLSNKQQSTVQLFHAQDEVLDSMRGSIARLNELNADIGREVGEHEAMLADVGEEMGVSEGLMDTSRKKIEKLLKGAPRYHLYLIAVMCVIVVVLLYFILYT